MTIRDLMNNWAYLLKWYLACFKPVSREYFQVSKSSSTLIISFQLDPAFKFSTLTRNKNKNSTKVKGAHLENYLGDGSKDNVVRYSTIGRGSRAANFVRSDFEGEMGEPRSLNTSYENNHLYYWLWLFWCHQSCA